MSYSVEGQDKQSAAANPLLSYVSTKPDYFETLGVPIQKGRAFTSQDRIGAPLVVIVSEAVARRAWPGQDAIGKRLKLGPPDYPDPWRTVVGVAADTRYRDLLDQRASLYVPALQPPNSDGVWIPTILVVRSHSGKRELLPSLRGAIKEIDPDLGILSAASSSELLEPQLARPRFNAVLLDVLGILALVLAVTGLYGVIATDVAQRTREIGIRMALGASSGSVVWLIMREILILAVTGLAIGLTAAFGLTRLVEAQLFGIKATDIATMLLATFGIAAVALLAGYLPARRATALDPMRALRFE